MHRTPSPATLGSSAEQGQRTEHQGVTGGLGDGGAAADRQKDVLTVGRQYGVMPVDRACQQCAQGAHDGGRGVKERVDAVSKAGQGVEAEVIKVKRSGSDAERAGAQQHLVAGSGGIEVELELSDAG